MHRFHLVSTHKLGGGREAGGGEERKNSVVAVITTAGEVRNGENWTTAVQTDGLYPLGGSLLKWVTSPREKTSQAMNSG